MHDTTPSKISDTKTLNVKALQTNIYRLIILAALVVATGLFVFATVLPSIAQTPGSTEEKEARRLRLEGELKSVEAEIRANRAVLHTTRQEGDSIERDVDILTAEIRDLQLQVQRHNISIQRLGKDIALTQTFIGELDSSISFNKDQIATLVRQKSVLDDYSFIEMLLSNENLSEFFEDQQVLTEIRTQLKTVVDESLTSKDESEVKKGELAEDRTRETDAKFSVQSAKGKIEAKEAEKSNLLAVKRGEEKGYEVVIEQNNVRAAEIRAALFALRDTGAIPFGQALQYANAAQAATGVRPAFLLAILKQESNIGENVGTCNRPGDPPEKRWRAIMPGPNDGSWRDDQSSYLQITAKLGLDPEAMPLSCPLGYGWGGAMGPAQFIPATWQQYENRVAAALGVGTANPWNPQHAFMASASYLADLGAGGGGYTAERTAALKYYSGGNWQDPRNQFYGDGVMRHAQDIQINMIDPLQ